MKIISFAMYGPNRSGLYETTRDLALAMRRLGVDHRIVSPIVSPGYNGPLGGDKIADNFYTDPLVGQPLSADLYINHTIVPNPYNMDGTPIIMFGHSMPEALMRTELYQFDKNNPAPFSTVINLVRNKNVKAYVTMWKRHLPFLEAICYKRKDINICLLPPGIDLKKYNYNGISFPLSGSPTVSLFDVWRENKDPFVPLMGYKLFWEKYPLARLHLFGAPHRKLKEREFKIWASYISNYNMEDGIGSINAMVPECEKFLRSADIVLSSVITHSRVQKEAMACGCQVVVPDCCDNFGFFTYKFGWATSVCDALEKAWVWLKTHKNREVLRKKQYLLAKKQFDINNTAKEFLKVCERVLNK